MRKRTTSVLGLAVVGVLALAGCSGGASDTGDTSSTSTPTSETSQTSETGGEDPTSEPTETGNADEIGAPEKTELTIALSAPNVDSQAPVWIAIDKGYYAEEGLTINVIDADDTVAGLVGGSLDLAVVDSTEVVDAAAAGTGVQIVAGYRQRQPFLVAARNNVQQPSDLEGKQVILGDAPGTPIIDIRLDLLKQSGFDLTGVGYTDVYPPGFSNAWVENFVQGQVEMTILFPRHIPLIEAADGYLILDEKKEWPNDSLAATEQWTNENPNTLARFIRATLKGIDDYLDLTNQQYVQDMMVANDFTVTDVERDPEIYAHGPALYTAGMPLDEKSFVDKLTAEGATEIPEWDVYTDTTALERALAGS